MVGHHPVLIIQIAILLSILALIIYNSLFGL